MVDSSGVPSLGGDSGAPAEWDFLEAPNCPDCLHSMEPTETPRGGVHWLCPNCGAAKIA